MPEILTGSAAVAEGNALTARRQPSRERLAQINEAAQLVGRVFAGDRRAMVDLQEAMSTSDFPILFGEVIDRELMAQYQAMPSTWRSFARRTVVRDFRPKKWKDLIGGRGLLERIDQHAPYPERSVDEGEYELSVGKYGARIGLSWETLVNDDLDAFRTLPERLAQAAVETEDHTATSLVTGATGANAAFFGTVDTAALTTDSLSAALTTISNRRDVDDRPIIITGFVLMVPPALEVTAMNIVNATEIRITQGSNEVIVSNWLRNKVKVEVNPWLPVVDTSANAATTWYVLPAPTVARPALAVGFLRGHEVPDLRVKSDTGQRVGGGSVAPEDGSFDTDDIDYRVRHVLGGATLDNLAVYASDGTV